MGALLLFFFGLYGGLLGNPEDACLACRSADFVEFVCHIYVPLLAVAGCLECHDSSSSSSFCFFSDL